MADDCGTPTSPAHHQPVNPSARVMGAESVGIELSVLAELRDQTFDGEHDFVPELIEVFLNDATESYRAIQQAAAGADHDAVARLAHRFRSGAASLGALTSAALCEEIERAAGAGALEDTRALSDRLAVELEKARDMLAAYPENLAAWERAREAA